MVLLRSLSEVSAVGIVGATPSIFESMLRGGELWWSFAFRVGHGLVGSVLASNVR